MDFEAYDGEDPVLASPLLRQRRCDALGRRWLIPLLWKEPNRGFSGRQWSLYFATLAAFEEVQSSLPTFVPAGGVGCLITLAIVQTSCFTRTHHRVLA
jgi:hypothetical protein